MEYLLLFLLFVILGMAFFLLFSLKDDKHTLVKGKVMNKNENEKYKKTDMVK